MVDQNPRKGLEGQMLGLETGSRIEGEDLTTCLMFSMHWRQLMSWHPLAAVSASCWGMNCIYSQNHFYW